MTKNEAIKRLADTLRSGHFDRCDLEDAADALVRLEEERNTWKLLKETAEVLKDAPKWVSVKDKLPEEYKDEDDKFINYLCYIPKYGFDIANYMPHRHLYGKPSGVWMTTMGIPIKVTHWMPLPPLPKEEVTHEQD